MSSSSQNIPSVSSCPITKTLLSKLQILHDSFCEYGFSQSEFYIYFLEKAFGEKNATNSNSGAKMIEKIKEMAGDEKKIMEVLTFVDCEIINMSSYWRDQRQNIGQIKFDSIRETPVGRNKDPKKRKNSKQVKQHKKDKKTKANKNRKSPINDQNEKTNELNNIFNKKSQQMTLLQKVVLTGNILRKQIQMGQQTENINEDPNDQIYKKLLEIQMITKLMCLNDTKKHEGQSSLFDFFKLNSRIC